MIFCSFDDDGGYPPRFYRTPEEVRKDISEVKKRIREIGEQINSRELMELPDLFRENGEKSFLVRMSSLNEDMDAMKEELSTLCDTLDELKEEFISATEIMCKYFRGMKQ